MAVRTSGLGTVYWSCCLDGLSNSVSRELLCHICLFICSSLALESFSRLGFFFFFFKVKIGLVAEAIPETRSFCDYQQRELLGSQCLPMVSCLSF